MYIDKILEKKKFSLSEPKEEPFIENHRLQKGKSLKSVLINTEMDETNEKNSKKMSRKTMINNLGNWRNRKSKKSEDKTRNFNESSIQSSIKNAVNSDIINNNSKNPIILRQNSVNFSKRNMKKQKTNILESFNNNKEKKNRCLSYEEQIFSNKIEKKKNFDGGKNDFGEKNNDFVEKNSDFENDPNFAGNNTDLLRKNERNSKKLDFAIRNSEEQDKKSEIISKDVYFSLENKEETSDFPIIQPNSRENKFSRSILKKKSRKETKSFENNDEYSEKDLQKVAFI